MKPRGNRTPNLREVLEGPIVGLADRLRHADLENACKSLGLPNPNKEGSKYQRLVGSYQAASDAHLVRIAERFLEKFPPTPSVRNALQEVLWNGVPGPEIPKRFRRELAHALEGIDLWLSADHFEALLDQLWILDDDPLSFFMETERGLRNDIRRHVFRNPGDWTVDYLFERLGAYECSDKRFVLFLEGLASADVRPDVEQQMEFVRLVNDSLKPCGVELREARTEGGYPVFALSSLGKGVTARPKNLIFASQQKPDLRITDAISNDVEVVSGADSVLIYDRSIPSEGLTWAHLQEWWQEREHLNEPEAKKSLYWRLLASLPANSPPQRLLFEEYHRHFGQAVVSLPALLPEVWLHWDPKNVKERGVAALLRFRMDFLMLLPRGVRVVIEVDGKHHYANDHGTADPTAYGSMVAADRDLRLAGYDVYRFGGEELLHKKAPALVGDFFERLFKLHGVRFTNPE